MEQERPKAMLSGVLYGETAFWITIFGLAIVIFGIVIYFGAGKQFFGCDSLMAKLWAGEDARDICKYYTDEEELSKYWYLSYLSAGDAICMVGMSICALAGIFGMTSAMVGMVIRRERPRFYLLFALAILAILIMSATGVISVR